MMGDINIHHILAVTHCILCLLWQSYAHNTNYSNATGTSMIFSVKFSCTP